MSCVYSLNTNHLSGASFANIFSHSIGCLFVSLMVSFVVQKVLSLIGSHLYIFALFLWPWGTDPRKYYVLFLSISLMFPKN